jgi:hypothetical protein
VSCKVEHTKAHLTKLKRDTKVKVLQSELNIKIMEITEQQIKEAHNAACSQWKQKIEQWFPECFKPKYEIGKWYKSGKSIINYQGGTNAYGYYAERDKWEDVNDSWLVFKEECDKLCLATTEEVESMLIKEAKKKGYKKGTTIKSLITNDREWILDSDKFAIRNNNELWSNKYKEFCVFKDGKWATIVKTPKEMTLEEIEKQLGHKVKIVS